MKSENSLPVSGEKKQVWKEYINILGSIASITGIALLWFKYIIPDARIVAAIPVAFISSTVFLSAATLLAHILIEAYKFCARKTPALMKISLTLFLISFFSLAVFYGGVQMFWFTASAVQSLPDSFADWIPPKENSQNSVDDSSALSKQ